MRILWFNVETKKELRAKIDALQDQVAIERNTKLEVIKYNNEIANAYERMTMIYPLDLGQTVYDLQLRGDNGRYTKTKASREHSLINEVVVDKKNYFKLVDRLGTDVFEERCAAEFYLDQVCVK